MILHTNVKINLGLRVIGRREDGFHDIETLFVPYNGLQDLIEITPDYNDGATLIAENLPWQADKDLTVQAYNILRRDFDIPGVRIRLNKHTPVGAGLGGGSADAAFVIKALNKMFDLRLDDGRMAEYAAEIGSDCAFFIYNSPMFGSGRGEVLEPFDIDLSQYKIKVVVPDCIAVNTAKAYRDLDKLRSEDGSAATGLREILRRPIEEWRGSLVNDFENVIFPAHPELVDIKESLYQEGAVYAAMSGSGSAMFGLFRKPTDPAVLTLR